MNTFMEIVKAACQDIGTPFSERLKGHIEKGEWTEVANLSVSPKDYSDSENYWRDCFLCSLLRKCDLPGSDLRGARAVETFLACEGQNATTNARLSRYLPSSEYLPEPHEWRVADFIDRWRKEVSYVLGYLPRYLTPRFSSGSTYADVGPLITVPDKMTSVPTTYDSVPLLPFWETAWGHHVRDRNQVPLPVRGNIFFTVPKDAKSFRGCCKEASVAVSLQLDVGRLIKSRLKSKIGIDLYQGQDYHRTLAQKASKDGSLATIDLSNASDTLCRNLPALVLPELWHVLLDSLRAKFTRVEGKWFRLEKFSSMGNGFTFELESLIFATLARTIVQEEGGDPSQVSCYGDDLIVPSKHNASVLQALQFFGFTPNVKKTFSEGPFRESCGGDFFDGVPVRGHFLKTLPDEPQHWISIANGIRRSALAPSGLLAENRWKLVLKTWRRVLAQIPSAIRKCRGPESLGDLVIHDSPEFWQSRPSNRAAGWDVRLFKTYSPIPVVLPWSHWTVPVRITAAVLGFPSQGVTPRGGVSGYRITWTAAMPGVELRAP